MRIGEDRKRDILLIISALLFIIFATGLAVQAEVPTNQIVLPPVP